MKIYDQIRAHFAIRIGTQLHTLGQSKPFTIYHVPTLQDPTNWIIRVQKNSGKLEPIYITDILRVYTTVVSRAAPTAHSHIDQTALLHRGGLSYILAMLTTFDDIQRHPTRKNCIHYIAPKT